MKQTNEQTKPQNPTPQNLQNKKQNTKKSQQLELNDLN